jgi:ketol-acid reductoisomerase
MRHHSHTSQYGSLTRGARFADLPLRERMRAALDEIRSGAFAREWSDEQGKGLPTLRNLLALRDRLPVRDWERRTRAAFGLDAPSVG